MFSKFCVIMLLWWSADSFPDGAPIDACVKNRPNQPNHGQHRTQPLSTLPYRITASSVNYSPNNRITVSIEGNVPFKGFFIQARSVETDEWLGSWEETPNTTIHPECSSITHADPRNKSRATFVWIAPNLHGRVYFTLSSQVDNKFHPYPPQLFWRNAVKMFDVLTELNQNLAPVTWDLITLASREYYSAYPFRGTVLKDYGTFWANIIAEAPQDPAKLQILG